jgi:phytoene dehydrogenase-like protein
LILESHSKLGGCASNFYRSDREFSFEAGATTISGFDNPKPLGKLLDKLKLKDQASTRLKKLDIGMKVFYKDQIITRFSDQDKWLAENERVFKDNKIIELWKQIFKDEKLAWELLDQNENLMPGNLSQYFKILFSKDFLLNLKGLKLLPYLVKPFSKLLEGYQINNSDFINFINEQLMITTQSDYQKAPILSAIMGLNYPQEVYYPIGSIKNIGELILKQYQESGNQIHLRQEVKSIEKINDLYLIKTNIEKSKKSTSQENEFLTKAVISNAPIWTMKNLVKIDQYKKKIELECKKNPESWGAFTVYFAAKIKLELGTNYLQIHAPKEIPNCKTHPHSNGSIFVTISDSKLNDRAPEGWTSFTISTHTNAKQWFQISENEYQEKKIQTQEFIIDLLCSTIPELRYVEKSFLISGTPHSFEHYTKREFGFVGGIAHDYSKPLIFMPRQRLSNEKIYLTGDSTFPGQGIAAVVYSAMSLVNKL